MTASVAGLTLAGAVAGAHVDASAARDGARPAGAVVRSAALVAAAMPTRLYLPICARNGRVPSVALDLTLAGQLGGPSWGFDVEDGLAYRGEGPHLVAMDLAHLPAIRQVGRSEPLPDLVNGVDVVGSVAYVAAGQAGLLAVDVGDPGRPRLLAQADTSGAAASVASVDREA
jgi:hypothetical protein